MIRVFVGCSAGDDAESQAVLEYTIRQHASEPVDITWMAPSHDRGSPWWGWNVTGWGTPFTGFRWAIPEVCGFEGRAIYLDADMIVRADIAELWNADIPAGAFALVKGQGHKMRCCVMVLDCAEARGQIPPLAKLKPTQDQQGQMVGELNRDPSLFGQIEPGWNVVDLKGGAVIDDPAVKLIHYSSIAHQPHLPQAMKRLSAKGRTHWYNGEVFGHWRPELTALFAELLAKAREAGLDPVQYEPAQPFGAYGIRSYRNVRVKGFSA